MIDTANGSSPYAGLVRLYNATLRNPGWLLDVLGGSESTSGERVNYRTALTIAFMWRAQNIVSADVAGLPFEPKRREPDNDWKVDESHPAWFLLNGDSYEDLASYTMRETLTHWALLLGNGMAYILRDSRGRAAELIPAVPGELTWEKRDGRLRYINHTLSQEFEPRQIFHLRGLGDDMGGLNVLALARNSLGLALAEEKHGAQHFKNGGRPSVILRTDRELDGDQARELAEHFMAWHDEAGKPAVASGKLEVHLVPANNRDSQWVEARQQAALDVAGWTGVPPFRLTGDQPPYNGAIEAAEAYLWGTLGHWLNRWEAEANRKLLTRREYRSNSVRCIHDPSKITRMNRAAKVDEVCKLVEAMLITDTEGRAELGFAREDDGGERRNPNTTSGSPSEAGGDNDDSTASLAPADAVPRRPFVDLMAKQLGVMASTMSDQAQRMRSKDASFEGWSDSWESRTSQFLAEPISAASTVFSTMSLESVGAVVRDWAVSAADGGVLMPSPDELAEQIVGDPA